MYPSWQTGKSLGYLRLPSFFPLLRVGGEIRLRYSGTLVEPHSSLSIEVKQHECHPFQQQDHLRLHHFQVQERDLDLKTMNLILSRNLLLTTLLSTFVWTAHLNHHKVRFDVLDLLLLMRCHPQLRSSLHQEMSMKVYNLLSRN